MAQAQASTPQTLAQMVRAKYPGAYDDLDDAALESAVKAKFPGVYDDIPLTGASKPALPSALSKTSPTSSGGYNPVSHVIDQVGGAIGFAKRAGETVYNVGNLARSAASVPMRAVGLGSLPPVPTPEALKPQTSAQRIGGQGFDVAASAVPLVRGSQAIRAGAQMLPKAAQLPVRMAGEAGLSAGVASVQGGDPATAAVLGAAVPAVGAAARLLPPALREAAEKKVAQALGATKERFKALAAKRAPEILARGLSGSKKSLLEDATANARSAGQAVDAMLQQKGQQIVPLAPVIDALEQAKVGYQLPREIPMAEAVRRGVDLKGPGVTVNGNMVSVPITLDSRPIEQLTKLQNIMRELGDTATVEQVIGARRAWDQVVAQAGGFAHRQGSTFGVPLAEQSEAWAKKQATDAMRKLFADEVPDLAAVNKEFAFWKDLESILKSTKGRQQAQGPGLNRIITGTVMAGTGLATGDIASAVAAGYVAPKILQTMTSTQWRMVDANLRNSLADAIANGDKARIAGMTARIGAVLASKATRRGTDEKKP